ncbi:chitodextrinase [Aquimarina sp. EL_43]|uniref:GEVED domain-containing protein n=1 Tax=unclassified Aquimarina TaxID=2627091 RepID=UPI0018C98F45|nr:MULTISPECIES: GEVED domain-containing protein [unclassified Aquimarina]MBG6132237.1 chitodextrinase [Aquimarina sp. EL_35]MBG6153721.1 chitodextrinase [Aquimarina sp. EL_32]MBG6171877.1 chitodextrinase [Aquimarina sp. EL_43]
MKNQLVLFIGLFVFQFGFSQTHNFWKKNSSPIENENISSIKNNTEISHQHTYHLSVEKLKEVLSQCPKRFNSFGKSNVIIILPTEDGRFKKYRVKETNVLHPDLAKKLPDIKSYVGTSVNGENEVVHFSLGYNNFRAMIMKPDATITNIKPSTSTSKTYMVTSKTDGSEPINCQIIDNAAETFSEKSTKQAENSNKARKDANDGRVRVYRMAIAVTGELSKIYTDKAGVTNGSTQQRKAAVLAELNALMTRVNAVYERDLGTTFELVSNIENSIFLDGATDGITHGNTSISVNEGQGVLDAAIGNANYDIGHVLDSDGTGRGALRAVCDDSKKAQGATGAHPFTSVADYFYRTFVHEIGHQFGANHSFNNSCGGNRLDEGAVEPGGGNTIMAYTGCAPNTENTQYVFFHAKQIDEMWNHILSIESCAILRSIGNSAPVASIGGNYTIPRSTPFILEGSATDPNTASNQLTYTWNQMDKEIAPMPPRATSTNGPLFRYKPPSSSPNRYMPDLSTIKAGNASSEWEVTPSVARTMNFRFTVRDNHPGGGNTDSKDAVITVSGTAGPFVITSQNTRFNAPVGSTQTVTWNVAGTTGNGVNAATVDILLSTDGGNTYPITLASAVPNDGSQQITIPNNEGGVNRIMVRGTNHIFFDVTNANFSITDGNPDPMPTNYCAAGYQGNNYIAEVIFGDIINKSENSSYSDFTNLGTNLVKGGSYTLTVNPGIDFWDPNYFGAWIDWNKDGDFEDAGEEVLLATNGAGGITKTVVVPNTAKSGATRLRVRYKIHTAPESCGTARTNGDEVEDYFVFIKGDGTPDTQAPSTPTNLVASGVGNTFLTLNWNASTDNVGVTGYDVYQGSTNIGTYTGTTYNVTGLTAGTAYNFSVRAKDAAGNVSGSSNVVNVTTTNTPNDTQAPTAPSNLTASNVAQTTLSLSWTASTDNVGVTGYDVYRGTTRLTTVTGTSYNVSGLTANTAYSFSVKAKDAAGNESASSNTVNVTTQNPNDVVYCNASTTGNSTLHITNVTFGSINNTSTNTAYSDYTGISTSLTSGQATSLTVTLNNNSWTYNAVGVWIDWNRNGDFTDAGELVYSRYAGGPYTASITPPSGAVSNTSLRMRVRVGYGSQAKITPCGTDTYLGEVEDYTVTVGGTTSPTCNDGIQNGDETGVDCGGSCSPCQTDVTYCSATGNDGPEGVTNVTFAGINNSSARNSTGYDDFTSVSGSVNTGSGYTLTVDITGYNGGAADEIYAWIDWNKDGDFSDTDESYTLTKTTNLRGNVSISVPQTAATGATRMRLLVSYYDNENNPCDTGTNDVRYGEYEDYTIVINSSRLLTFNKVNRFTTVYPNPFNDTVTIDVSRLESDTFTITVYNLLGRELIHKKYSKNPGTIRLGDQIKSSGNYFVKIQANKHTETLRLVKF